MPSRLEQRCFERGIKLTEQRRVIARVLSQADGHPDVEEVYRRASCLDDQISLATVYRTLRLFEEAGLIVRHDHGDGRARYEGGWEPRDALPFNLGRGAAGSRAMT
jgi:Fur family transcriptional regulator, ferric uptake regulator